MTYSLDNKDRYGYYTVGTRKTYSKLEAIDYSHATGQPIEWHFNREIYGAFDWQTEPTASLDQLYEARARQLREQYDYLVLWYSGGADSHNILMAFVRASIYIDEIAQYHQLEAHSGNTQSWTNQEVYETAAPLTQQLIESNPIYATTRHRMVDMTEYQNTLFLDTDNTWDFFYKVNNYFSPNCLSRYRFRETIADYRQIIDSGRKLCFVFGVEKPVITKDSQGYWVHFNDGQDHGITAWAQQQNRPGDYDEFFYWAPDMPELPAKQAHVLKRYMEGITDQDVDGVHVGRGRLIMDPHGAGMLDLTLTRPYIEFSKQQKDYYLTMRGVHRVLYPDWDANAIVCGKPHSNIFPPRDSWMFHSAAPNIGQRFYTGGLIWLRNHVRSKKPELWWEFKFDHKIAPYTGGLKRISNRYFIGASDCY